MNESLSITLNYCVLQIVIRVKCWQISADVCIFSSLIYGSKWYHLLVSCYFYFVWVVGVYLSHFHGLYNVTKATSIDRNDVTDLSKKTWITVEKQPQAATTTSCPWSPLAQPALEIFSNMHSTLKWLRKKSLIHHEHVSQIFTFLMKDKWRFPLWAVQPSSTLLPLMCSKSSAFVTHKVEIIPNSLCTSSF